MALQTRCYALLHNSDLHAPADIGLDTGRLQQEAGEKKKTHECPNMTTNRGHQHILHQLTTCTGVQVLHWAFEPRQEEFSKQLELPLGLLV